MKIFGIFLDREKNTENGLTIALPTPERVAVPLPKDGTAEVRAGQWVLTGSRLCGGSLPAHASVSGKVEEIKEFDTDDGSFTAVVIKADENQKDAAVRVPRADDRESFIKCAINAVRESGCPAAEKISAAADADMLIVNGVESEQYVTSENRCMLDDGKLITAGIALISRLMGIEKTVIAVASDCEEAIDAMEKTAADAPKCEVVKVRPDHPAGADMVLVNNVAGRPIKANETAAEKKVMILLPSEVAFIASYFETGMPFIKRRVTVDGDLVKTPCVVEAPIGTPLKDLFAFADGNLLPAEKLVIGGLMTGRCVTDPELPLGKCDSAALIFMKPLESGGKGSLKVVGGQTNCIRCGRCAKACPTGLMPMRIEKAVKKRKRTELRRLRPDLCIGCGSCTYVCPAKRELKDAVDKAKTILDRKGGDEE